MRQARALIGFCVVIVLSACALLAEVAPPQVHLADIRLLDGGLLEQRFRVDLRIGNPNDVDLPLDGLTFALELNDRPFAKGFTNESVTVPRLGEATVAVVASTTLLDMVQQLLVLGQRADLSYRIEGLLYMKGLTKRAVPYERSGRMRLMPGPESEQTLIPL